MGNPPPVGQSELSYTEYITDVTVTATTEASAAVVVSAPAITFDGRPVLIEFFSPGARPDAGAANRTLNLWLYLDGVSIGRFGVVVVPVTGVVYVPIFTGRRQTPSAGSHTYSVRASVDAGTGAVLGDPGGTGQYVPGFIRISQANMASGPQGPPGPAGGQVLLCSSILAANANNFDTQALIGGAIPQTYNHLKAMLVGRDTNAVQFDVLNWQLNGDAGANYDYQKYWGVGATAQSAELFGGTNFGQYPLAGASAPAGVVSSAILDFPLYAQSVFNKTVQGALVGKGGIATGNMRAETIGGFWRNSGPITRIVASPGGGQFLAGSAFYLYGVV
jgi:hypothetical protein